LNDFRLPLKKRSNSSYEIKLSPDFLSGRPGIAEGEIGRACDPVLATLESPPSIARFRVECQNRREEDQ
jgi:hypothetical protein